MTIRLKRALKTISIDILKVQNAWISVGFMGYYDNTLYTLHALYTLYTLYTLFTLVISVEDDLRLGYQRRR